MSRYEYMHPAQEQAEDLRGFEEEFGPVPKHKVVCPQCRGEGSSSLYLGSYTQSEMDEQGPEFYEDYMTGAYDRTCDTCGGLRVIDEPDLKEMTDEIRCEFIDWMLEAAADRHAEDMERRMGA